MGKEIKIILIDDEVDFTQPMSFWFKAKGYAVLVANDGETAIKLIKEQAPDIAFLDLNMPVMDGVGVLKNIRKFDKELPVIMISAYVDDPRVQEAREYGISGLFYKGKDFSEGLSLLEAALRTHKNLKK